MDDLTQTIKDIIYELQDFGIVYINNNYAYCTPVTKQLTLPLDTQLSESVELKDDILFHDDTGIDNLHTKDTGYLIVETNLQMYAYTTSDINLCILSLFSTVEYSLPYMSCCKLSRSSVNKALNMGLTAEHIINYLKDILHPNMKQNSQAVKVIFDQLKIWEQKKHRFVHRKGVLFYDFDSQDQFLKCIRYARNLDVLIWCNEDLLKLFVTEEGKEMLVNYIKSLS